MDAILADNDPRKSVAVWAKTTRTSVEETQVKRKNPLAKSYDTGNLLLPPVQITARRRSEKLKYPRNPVYTSREVPNMTTLVKHC